MINESTDRRLTEEVGAELPSVYELALVQLSHGGFTSTYTQNYKLLLKRLLHKAQMITSDSFQTNLYLEKMISIINISVACQERFLECPRPPKNT